MNKVDRERHPDNCVMVDYGGRSELVLLATIDISSRRDSPLPDYDGPVCNTIEIVDELNRLYERATPNARDM